MMDNASFKYSYMQVTFMLHYHYWCGLMLPMQHKVASNKMGDTTFSTFHDVHLRL